MPVEIRHIVFTPDEIVTAIVHDHHARGRAVPCGRISRAEVLDTAPGEPIAFGLVIAPNPVLNPGAGTAALELTMSGAELAAALISYCKHCRVPVPRKGVKSLQRIGGSQIGLIVTMGIQPSGAAPAR
ncbi:hypothetical protein ACFQX4_28545 [Roseomonas sp. GCM10028921]